MDLSDSPWREADLAASPWLPRLGAAAARIGNALLARSALTLSLDPAATVRTLRWQPVAMTAAPHAAAELEGSTHPFRAGGLSGSLVLDARALAAVLCETEALLLPDALRSLLLADRLAPLVHGIEDVLRHRLEWTLPEEVPPLPASAALAGGRGLALPFDLHGADGRRLGQGLLQLDDAAAAERCLLAMSATAPRPATSTDGTAAAVRLPLAYRLGSTVLAVQDLRALAPGDIVRIDDAAGHGDRLHVAIVVAGRTLGWRAEADDTQLRLLPWKENPMDPTPEAAPPAEPALPASRPVLDTLDDVSLRLHFEIDGLPLTLGELRALQPGHVFELPQHLSRCSVAVLVQGQRLGEGTLVGVGDHLGVRIASVATERGA